jgi:hypothetical protein
LDNLYSEFWDIHWGVQNDDAKQTNITKEQARKLMKQRH